MAYTIEEIKAKINSYPTKQPVFKAGTDSSGDLVFRMVDQQIPSPFNNPDAIEEMIESNLKTQLVENDNGTYRFINDVDSTFSSVMERIVSDLQDKLRKASPSQDPKRTKLYKWFRNYSPRGLEEKKLALLIFDYTEKNAECTLSGSKHAQNFVGLITHMWSKYGSGK